MILRFAGTEAPGYVRRALREGRAAGVILFRDNVASPGQLRRRSPARCATGDGRAADLRRPGGRRRPHPAWAPPERSQAAPAAAGTVRAGRGGAGRALRDAGVNVTLAPVGGRPERRGAALAGRRSPATPTRPPSGVAESVGGWHAGGVATDGQALPRPRRRDRQHRRRPGHDRPHARAELRRRPAPFRAAIAAGTALVMAGHATYPALDPDHIASQSPAIIDGLLREELGFKGVVMTDSLEAAAVQAVGDVERGRRRIGRARAST